MKINRCANEPQQRLLTLCRFFLNQDAIPNTTGYFWYLTMWTAMWSDDVFVALYIGQHLSIAHLCGMINPNAH